MIPTGHHGRLEPVNEALQPECGSFGYLFPDAESPPYSALTPQALRDLQAELYRHGDPEDANNSGLAPVFTYFGQFIDHDITNQGLARPADAAIVDIFDPGDDFSPRPRPEVAEALRNQRTGRFDLDSLYGPPPGDDAALNKLIGLMRFPSDRAKMWLARPVPVGTGIPGTLPLDGAADLLRLGALMNGPSPRFTQADFDALPEAIKGGLRSADGTPNMRAAVIGDPRNDENLFVAQLHLAFLRFHNRMVDAWPGPRQPGDAEQVFAWARRQVTLHYQWLVLHVYLPAICDPVALQQVKASGGALYRDFLAACGHQPGSAFPMPIEFAAAAFRFGHSMVRGTYDWNSVFGRGDDPDRRATFQELFLFTGRGANPLAGLDRLPENWVIDWSRTAMPGSEFADRTTRRLDTNMATALESMINEGEALDEKNLAARNLKRSARFSVPGGQACVAALNAAHGFNIRPMTKAELTQGRTGNELEAARYVAQTPLWFYVLKEAEIRHSGQRLGALGTHIVAGTLAGLLIHDPQSVWAEAGSHEGRWHPVDGVRASGQLVDSIPALLRAALLLEA